MIYGLRDFPEWEWGQVSKMMYYYEMYKNWAFIDKPRETDLSWEFMDWNWSLMRIWPVPSFLLMIQKRLCSMLEKVVNPLIILIFVWILVFTILDWFYEQWIELQKRINDSILFACKRLSKDS